MTISPYFNHHKLISEQELYEDLVIETIQLSGVDVYYLPADREIDPILGEPVRSSFKTIIPIEVYLPDGGAASGEGEIMSKFGFATREKIDVVVSSKRFINLAQVNNLNLIRPREGDIIFVGDLDRPYGSQINEFYEITYVTSHEAQWTFGNTFAYKVSLSALPTSHEKFETNTALDGIMTDDIQDDIESGINNAVKTTKQTFMAFDKKNPLSNI